MLIDLFAVYCYNRDIKANSDSRKVNEMSKQIQTVKIMRRDILAKTTKVGTFAVTYSNHSQALAKVNELRSAGVESEVVQFSRPFYVAMK